MVGKIVVLCILLVGSASSVWAACEEYTAGHWYPGSYASQSLTQADIQSCIDNAAFASGDTIHLKAGDETWTGSITINKAGVIILGATTGCPTACVDNTNITLTTGNSAFLAQRDDWRISGITFINGSAAYGTIYANWSGTNATSGWRIDHNHFTGFTGRAITVGAGASAANYAKDYPGLIDNNRFYSATRRKALEANGHSMSAHGSWDDALDLGGADWVFFEDNIAVFDALVDGTANTIDASYNGKIVVRFNSFTNSDIATHGPESCQDATADVNAGSGVGDCAWYSVRGMEIYNNTMTFSVSHSFTLNLRGGTGVVWGNTVSGTTGTFGPWRYFYERGDGLDRCATKCQGSSTGDGNQDGKYGYVCYQQPGTTGATGIETLPIYQWYNTAFASTSEADNSVVTYDASCNYQHVQFGRDIILMERTSVGTSLPASCTTGAGYWKTNEGTWNKKPGGSQGVLYKCTATDTWTLYYTPYEYPHPLQGYTATATASHRGLSFGGGVSIR